MHDAMLDKMIGHLALAHVSEDATVPQPLSSGVATDRVLESGAKARRATHPSPEAKKRHELHTARW